MTLLNIIISEPARLKLKGENLQYQRDIQTQTIPLNDIGSIILEAPNITLSHELIQACYASRTLIMTCDSQFYPNGVLAPLIQYNAEKQPITLQVNATTPFKKRTWQKIVKTKISGQCKVLAWKNLPTDRLKDFAKHTKSGDVDNTEPLASKYYFTQIYNSEDFKKHDIIRAGINYGNLILRAMLIQQFSHLGLHPALGIHHKNEHKAFNLADDFIEALSPILDIWWLAKIPQIKHSQLDDNDRQHLNDVLQCVVKFERKSYPLQTASHEMVKSLIRALKSKDPHQMKFPSPVLPQR